MKNLLLLLLINLCTISLNAQWITTPIPASGYRYDDIYFMNPTVGWAVNYSLGNDGAVLKTTDGAASWQTLVNGSGAKFRDVGFVDSLNGFIGTLSTGYFPQDTVIMYKSNDGGLSWNDIQNFPGPRPAGICGMFVINDSTLYACGRYYGPSGFYKTTDKGDTWSYTDLSSYAGGIVDLHFFNKDTGIAVGGTLSNFLNGQARVIRTTDGGNTWTIVHTSSHPQEIGWKISFPSPNVGYISLESFRFGGPQYFLKTIDGGVTWTDQQFMSSGTFDALGIGFITDSIGWIGGNPSVFKTIDGGTSWTNDNFGTVVNRFRFFGDTLGYAAGQYVYKFDVGITSLTETLTTQSHISICPNPFSTLTAIAFKFDYRGVVKISIADISGRIVRTLTEKLYSGDQKYWWNGTNDAGTTVSEGIYFITVETGQESKTLKVVKL